MNDRKRNSINWQSFSNTLPISAKFRSVSTDKSSSPDKMKQTSFNMKRFIDTHEMIRPNTFRNIHQYVLKLYSLYQKEYQ